MSVERIARRKGTGHVGAGALVGKDPEVQLREEAGEVGEGLSRLREGLDPEVG